MDKKSSGEKGPRFTLVPPTPEQAKHDAEAGLQRAVDYALRVGIESEGIQQVVSDAIKKALAEDNRPALP